VVHSAHGEYATLVGNLLQAPYNYYETKDIINQGGLFYPGRNGIIYGPGFIVVAACATI
jgi:hypothetical protein